MRVRRSARDALRAALAWRPLLAVLLAGAALRIFTLLAYRPTSLQWFDAIRFARVDPSGAFDDAGQPAGYPAFLWLLRQLADQLSFTVAVQHVVGVACGLLLYATARQLGAPRGVALLPAAVVLLGGDYLFLETLLLPDSLLLLFACLTAFAAARAVAEPGRGGWIAAASAFGGSAGLVRGAGIAVPLALAVWAGLALARPSRVRAVVLAIAPALLLLLAYGALATTAGRYAGLTDQSDLNLYSRVAPFADCHAFAPPLGTRQLCESRSPALRPGPYFYASQPASPGLRAFGPAPEREGPLGAWARAVVAGEPASYLKAVVKDLLRYADPTAGRDRDFSGGGPDAWTFGYRDANTEQLVGRRLGSRYSGVLPARLGGIRVLEAYQRLSRLGGLFVAGFAVLALLGLVAARGRLRAGVALLSLLALALYLVPAATLSYDYAYGVVPAALLTGAAALGGWALVLSRR